MPVLFLCNKLHSRINREPYKALEEKTIPLHWTQTPAGTSHSRSPEDEEPQQDPAAKEVAAAVVHEDISSACTSRSIQARQSHMSSYVNISKPVSIEKNKQLDNQLVCLIAREYHLFSLVEDAEFRRFVQILCPGYQIPSRKTLTNSLIPILHQTTVLTFYVSTHNTTYILHPISIC
jgi:hypothetical protein